MGYVYVIFYMFCDKCWMLDAGCCMLCVGCCMLDAGCCFWMLARMGSGDRATLSAFCAFVSNLNIECNHHRPTSCALPTTNLSPMARMACRRGARVRAAQRQGDRQPHLQRGQGHGSLLRPLRLLLLLRIILLRITILCFAQPRVGREHRRRGRGRGRGWGCAWAQVADSLLPAGRPVLRLCCLQGGAGQAHAHLTGTLLRHIAAGTWVMMYDASCAQRS